VLRRAVGDARRLTTMVARSGGGFVRWPVVGPGQQLIDALGRMRGEAFVVDLQVAIVAIAVSWGQCFKA